MTDKYINYSKEVKKRVGEYRKSSPEVMQAFGGLIKAAETTGVLESKIKELIALAISISSHCEDCITAHIQSYIKANGTREELVDMIGVAVFMGGGPAMMYGTHALEAYDEFAT